MNKDKFYFTYVKSLDKKATYMVLAYYKTKKSIPFTLDFMSHRVVPANKKKGIKPIYSFNLKKSFLDKNIGLKIKEQQKIKLKNLLINLRKGKI